MAKIALIQMCSTANLQENLHTAARLLKEAKQVGAVLAVLPENFTLIGNPADNLPNRERLDQGPIQDFLVKQARELKLWLIAGTVPIQGPDSNRFQATVLVYNDQGERVAAYRKIHLYHATLSATEIYREANVVEPGLAEDTNVVVVDTPVGRVGLMVCYDMRFPALAKKLAAKGAEIIISPTAFTVPTGEAHWHVLSRALAIQNLVYFAAACQGGKHSSGRATYGHSLVVEPWGKIIAEIEGAEQTEGVLVADIDLSKIAEARQKLPLHEHHRLS